jgi:hypothetical protein
MATTITAGNATNGLVIAPDNTGILELKTGTGAGTTAMTLSSAQAATFAGAVSVTGNATLPTIRSNAVSTPPTIQDSAGTQIGTFCRAWVNFNGTGTVAIRASFNVTSITDNGTGDYTVNFTNALPDANYAHNITTAFSESSYTPLNNRSYSSSTKASASLRFVAGYVSSTAGAFTAEDTASVQVAIFR